MEKLLKKSVILGRPSALSTLHHCLEPLMHMKLLSFVAKNCGVCEVWGISHSTSFRSASNQIPCYFQNFQNLHGIQNQVIIPLFFMFHSISFL